jgi:hypothetical protein
MLTSKYSHSKRSIQQLGQNNILMTKRIYLFQVSDPCETRSPEAGVQRVVWSRRDVLHGTVWAPDNGTWLQGPWTRGWWHYGGAPKLGSYSQLLLQSINACCPWIVSLSRWAGREVCNDLDESLVHLQSVPDKTEPIGFVPLLGGIQKVYRFGISLRAKA